MGVGAFSGGVIFAVAAVLWLVYLVPSWLRRGQYLATERNAVRLQQTLRIMAETAEVPQEIRIESAARVAAEQKRVLREAEAEALAESRTAADVAAKLRRMEAARRAEALAAVRAAAAAEAQARAAAQERGTATGANEGRPALTARTIGGHRAVASVSPARSGQAGISRDAVRRLRLLSTFILIAGIIGLGIGGALLAGQGAWTVFSVSALGAVLGFVSLRRLARSSVAEEWVRVVSKPQPVIVFDSDEREAVRPREEPLGWVPTPLPKPLYLSRGTVAANAMASIDAAVELRRAADKSELALRAAELEPDVPTLIPAAVRQETALSKGAQAAAGLSTPPHAASVSSAGAKSSRFAAMGVVDEAGGGHIDLDAVLRRRRAG